MDHWKATVDLKDVVKGLNSLGDKSEKVFARTVGEMKTKLPTGISKTVRQEYGVDAKAVKDALRVERGGNIPGTTVRNMVIKYRGHLLTPVHFGMRPKERKAGGKPYSITATIRKSRGKKELHGKSYYRGRPFLASTGAKSEGKVKQIPFQRETTERTPITPIKTISVPQMIEDKNGVKPEIVETIDKIFAERFEHNFNYIMSKGK